MGGPDSLCQSMAILPNPAEAEMQKKNAGFWKSSGICAGFEGMRALSCIGENRRTVGPIDLVVASRDDGSLTSAKEAFIESRCVRNGPAMTESHSQSEVQARRQVDAPKAAAQSRNEPTDDELLKRYHSARDEAAFALLVNRY